MIQIHPEISFLFSSVLTIIMLLIILAIFGLITARYRNIRRFELQISIFILLYIIGEIFEVYKFPTISTSLPYIGPQFHITAALFLAVMLWLRLFSVRKNEYKMIDKFESAEKPDDNVNGNIP
ncbi:MAG: hypothetical protein ACTHKP_07210 [Nitrososphaeraceae archaeon]